MRALCCRIYCTCTFTVVTVHNNYLLIYACCEYDYVPEDSGFGDDKTPSRDRKG